MTLIQEQVRNFVLSNYYVGETLDIDTPLLDGIIDSTGVVEMIGFIEETFRLVLDDSELLPENFASVEAIARFIFPKLNPVKETV